MDDPTILPDGTGGSTGPSVNISQPQPAPPPADPFAAAEQQARNLFGAGLGSLGQAPNPQLVTEAITSGGSQDVASSFSDPTLAPYAQSQPGGLGNPPKGPQNGPGQPGSTLDTFDWDAYWQKMHSDLQHDEAWQKFGEVPQMNFAYIQGVQNAGPDAGKKWQSMLQDRGFLAQTHTNDGTWDNDTKTALQGFYAAMALPTAIYSKDPQAKAQASLFLQRYTGINAVDLQNEKRNDPTFQAQLVENWTATQGPDRQRDAIHDFVDQFGANNVPQTIQDIADPGFLTNAAQVPYSIVGGLAGLIGLGASKALGKENVVGEFIAGHSPEAMAEQHIASQLTQNDKDMLKPALDQLNQSSGFMPITWFDQQKNNVLLAAKYTFEDMAHGKVTNPLDALDVTSDLGKRIGAHHDDIMAGLFGDQWVKDHPTAAMWTGLVVNTLDDPFTWTGLEGVKLGELGHLEVDGATGAAKQAVGATARLAQVPFKVAGAAAKLLTSPRTMADAASPALRKIAADTWAPRAATQRAAVDGIIAARIGADGATGNKGLVMQLLGVDNGAYLTNPVTSAAIDKIMDPSTDAHGIRAIMNDTFSHKWQGTHNVYNRIAAMQTVLPDALRKQSEGFAGKYRALGGFAAAGRPLDLTDQGVHRASKTIEQTLAILGADINKTTRKIVNEQGMPENVDVRGINEIMGKFWGLKDQTERVNWVNFELPGIMDTILKGSAEPRKAAMTSRSIWAAEQKHNRGRSFAKFQNPELQAALGNSGRVDRPAYLVTPKGDILDAKEESVYFANGGHAQDLIGEKQASLDQMISEAKDSLRAKNPAWQESQVEWQALANNRKIIDAETAEIERLQQAMDDVRPGPAVTGQLGQHAVLPFTPYGAMVAMHPHLSKLEDIQSALRTDAINSTWKGLALIRPSTSARMLVGDDTIRTAAYLGLNGHGLLGAQALVGGTLSGLAAPMALLARGAQNAVGRKRAERAGKEYEDKTVKWIDSARATVSANLSKLELDKYLHDNDTGNWDMYAPSNVGYKNAFKQTFRFLNNSPEITAWAKAENKYKGSGLNALKQAYRDKVPGTEEIIGKAGGTTDEYAEKINQHMLAFTDHQDVLKMLANGHVDDAALDKAIKNDKISRKLPNVGGPKNTAGAQNAITRAITQGPGHIFHEMATPMITAARANNFKLLHKDYVKSITAAHPDWANDPEMIHSLAAGDAAQWMEQNLYQGQRSIAGQFSRNVFPFGGATSNMSRFWIREAKAHPWLWDPGGHALLSAEENSDNPNKKTTGIGENVLGALGFAGQDGLNADFSHSLFLSSDGIASFVPGFGPMFSPLVAWADKNQAVHDLLGSIPGVREQVKLASRGTTPIPSFIGTDVNAISEAAFGKSITGPFGLGVDAEQNDQAIDNKFKQLLTDYQNGKMDHEPTRDDAIKSLGRDQAAGGALNALLPIQPSITDERRAAITAASSQMRSAGSPAAREAVIAANPDVAPYLRYIDPTTPLADKDALATDPSTSWVVSYAQSNTETDDPSIAKPSNLTDYDIALQTGNLHVLGVDGLEAKITKSRNYAAGWKAYDENVVAAENKWLLETGNSKTSRAYRDYSKTVIGPILKGISDNNPDWYAQFIQSRSQPKDLLGLELKTQPLRSLQNWEVLPQASALETPKTVMWRKALVARDWATNKLNEVINGHGPQADKDAVMTKLKSYLSTLEAQNPEFADELRLYSFNKWTDLVDANAMAKRDARQ